MALVLADLCDDFFGLLRLAERRGARDVFDEVVDVVRQGRRPDTDRLDALFAALGLDADAAGPGTGSPGAGGTRTAGGQEPPGGMPSVATGGGHVADRPYVCPLGVCPRAVLRRAGHDAPMCDIGERPLVTGR
ncbi:hypothetical protein [Streptomyces griseosporeus]